MHEADRGPGAGAGSGVTADSRGGPAADRRDRSGAALFALLLGAEAAILHLITLAAFGRGRGAGGGVALPVLFGLLWAGALLHRRPVAALPKPLARVVGLGALSAFLVGAVLLVPRLPGVPTPPWGAIALAGYAGLRGYTRAEPDVEAAERLLRLGTVAILAALVAASDLAAAVGPERGGIGSRLLSSPYAVTVGFFGCALAALALARLREEQALGALAINRRWLTIFLGPVTILLLAGVLLSGLATRRLPDVIGWLLAPLAFLGELLRLVLRPLAAGFARLWQAMTSGVPTNEGLLPTPTTPDRALPTPTPTAALADAPTATIPDPWLYLGAVAFLIAGVCLLIYLLRRRRAPGPAPEPQEERRRSVFRWQFLGATAARPFRRFRRRRADSLAHLRGDPRWRHTLAIRELYRRLLQRGATAAHPRAPAQTPDEYAPILSTAFDGASDAIEALTTRYTATRYRDGPAGPEDAAATHAAWEAFERTRQS